MLHQYSTYVIVMKLHELLKGLLSVVFENESDFKLQLLVHGHTMGFTRNVWLACTTHPLFALSLS